MKELYLGLAIIALALIILSITVETSFSGSLFKKNVNRSTTQIKPQTTYVLSKSNLSKSFPDRAYGKNELNNLFLRKYYNNSNNYNPKKKFYV